MDEWTIAEYLSGILLVFGLFWLIAKLMRGLLKRFVDLEKFTKWYENRKKLRADIRELKAEVDMVSKEMIKD